VPENSDSEDGDGEDRDGEPPGPTDTDADGGEATPSNWGRGNRMDAPMEEGQGQCQFVFARSIYKKT
jgi:hypothetical protein